MSRIKLLHSEMDLFRQLTLIRTCVFVWVFGRTQNSAEHEILSVLGD